MNPEIHIQNVASLKAAADNLREKLMREKEHSEELAHAFEQFEVKRKGQ